LVDENGTDDWASTEFREANLGDARLAQRLVALARRLGCSPQGSFPQSLKAAELKAAYRFFDNAQVDTNGILAPHIAQTLDRMSRVPVVLAVQDTTEFNLSHLPATEGLGYGTGKNPRGFMMHSLLAVTPEGLPLGVLGMKTWVRLEEERGRKHHRKTRPIAGKESIKWLEGIEHLAALRARCAETRLVGVGDRESDLYELFAQRHRYAERLECGPVGPIRCPAKIELLDHLRYLHQNHSGKDVRKMKQKNRTKPNFGNQIRHTYFKKDTRQVV